MSIQKLDTWAAKFVQTFPLSVLKDSVIGVDATYYLDLRLNENKEEPLKSALGGVPFALRAAIEDDIQAAKDAGVTLIFVFDGLQFVNKPPPSSSSTASKSAHEEGWRHYLAGDATSPVTDFGRAKYPLEIIYRYLRKILYNSKVEYLVAPYSATAQLAYMCKTSDQYVDAVMSSADAFLFDIDKIILNINSKQQPSFDWLSKSVCEERLGRISGDLFRDAQLLLGSNFLPEFPILKRNHPNGRPNVSDALNLLNTAGRSVIQLCNQFREDPEVQNLEYADRYKKAIMAIKHHIVLDSNGVVAPLNFEYAPGDVHEFVGQRLPEELFFYISKGILASQVPNWLTTGEVNLTLPGGVMDSEPYRRLLIEQLNPVRTQALKIVAESLNYYYSSREVILRTWDNNRDTTALKIELKTVLPLKAKASEWKVQEADILAAAGKSARIPSISSCIRSLQDKSFAQKTITKGRVEHPAIKSQTEILANVYWRFLHIRGYVDDKHELTSYGAMLDAALTAVNGNGNMEELAVVAVELFRLGLLNTNSVTGAPVPTSDKEYRAKTSTNLIAKIACLGRLKHEPVGYAGALDRQLLSFAWMVTAVRTSLRDLIEAILASMFLNGDVSRVRDDWHEIPQKLPFISDNGAALGVATKTYLDAVRDEKELAEGTKEKIMKQEDEFRWFSHIKGGTLTKSLETAFKLFDIVNTAVQAGSKDSKDIKTFADAGEWLAPRR